MLVREWKTKLINGFSNDMVKIDLAYVKKGAAYFFLVLNM